MTPLAESRDSIYNHSYMHTWILPHLSDYSCPELLFIFSSQYLCLITGILSKYAESYVIFFVLWLYFYWFIENWIFCCFSIISHRNRRTHAHNKHDTKRSHFPEHVWFWCRNQWTIVLHYSWLGKRFGQWHYVFGE